MKNKKQEIKKTITKEINYHLIFNGLKVKRKVSKLNQFLEISALVFYAGLITYVSILWTF